MATTTTEQVREATTVNGIVNYKIVIGVTDRGDLPTDGLFVLLINDETDAKEDTLARVATIADFTEIGTDRVAAVAAGEDYFRAASIILYYDNLETGNNAQKVLKEKIDELVSDYALYLTEFGTSSEVIAHPQVDEATYDATVTEYQDAMRDTLDAQATRDDAETAYNDKVTECAATTTTATEGQTIADDCATTKGFFDVLRTAFTTLDGEADIFVTAANAYYAAKVDTPAPSAADTTFLTAIGVFAGQLRTSEAVMSQATTDNGDFDTVCDARTNENTTKQNNLTTCNSELAAARTAYEDAQAAVEVAQKAEAAALAAVQALKPSFDPTSVDPSDAT